MISGNGDARLELRVATYLGSGRWTIGINFLGLAVAFGLSGGQWILESGRMMRLDSNIPGLAAPRGLVRRTRNATRYSGGQVISRSEDGRRGWDRYIPAFPPPRGFDGRRAHAQVCRSGKID